MKQYYLPCIQASLEFHPTSVAEKQPLRLDNEQSASFVFGFWRANALHQRERITTTTMR
jgi:hypothetical protein